MVGRFVALDLAPLLADMVFELPRRGGEGVAHGHVHVFVSVMQIPVPPREDLFSRDMNVHVDRIEVAVVPTFVRCLDGDPATDDVVVKQFQLLGLFPDTPFYRVGAFDSVEADLQGLLHG